MMRFIFIPIILGVDGQKGLSTGLRNLQRTWQWEGGSPGSIGFQVSLLNEMPREGFLPGEYPAL